MKIDAMAAHTKSFTMLYMPSVDRLEPLFTCHVFDRYHGTNFYVPLFRCDDCTSMCSSQRHQSSSPPDQHRPSNCPQATSTLMVADFAEALWPTGYGRSRTCTSNRGLPQCRLLMIFQPAIMKSTTHVWGGVLLIVYINVLRPRARPVFALKMAACQATSMFI